MFRPGSLQERKNKIRRVVGRWGEGRKGRERERERERKREGGRNYKCATGSDTPLLGWGPLLFGAIASKMLARVKTKGEYCSLPFESCFFARINAVHGADTRLKY